MNFKFTFLLALLFAGFSLSAQFVILSGEFPLSGTQEALPVTTSASGSITVEVYSDNTFRFSGSFSNLSSPVATEIGGGMHIHEGLPGSNGPVLFPLVFTLSEDSLSGTLNPEDNIFSLDGPLGDITFGGAYVNLHTQDFPGGELRGVITLAGPSSSYANLFGNNEVNPIVSPASGAVFADVIDDQLVLTGSFNNLSSRVDTNIVGGAHIHIGYPGQNGGVDLVLDIELAEDGRSGIFTPLNVFDLTPAQQMLFSQGQYYVNIHTENFPGGELRGQILPFASTTFRAFLSGSNEWPVVTTSASGQIIGHLAADSTLRITGSFSGLSSPVATEIVGGAHLHAGMAGQNGDVIFPLTIELDDDSLGGTFSIIDNVFELDDDQYDMLLNRGIYFNLHTDNFQSGELRGQLLPESQAIYTAYLSGDQEIPNALTSARGMVKIEQLGDQVVSTGSFTGLGSDLATNIAGGAHLHAGYPGQSGPVEIILGVTQDDNNTSGTFLPADNRTTLTGGLGDTLANRQLYVNIHSLNFGGGEIRGQVLAEANAYYYVPLSSASAINYTPTDANGLLAGELHDTTMVIVGSWQETEGNYAADIAGGMHLHAGLAGEAGDIVFLLNTEVDADQKGGTLLADSNAIQMTPAQLEVLNARGIYANIHTDAYPAGEVRGQVQPLAGTYFHATLNPVNTVPLRSSDATGTIKIELTGDQLVVSGSAANLGSDLDTSIVNGAHLHLGANGQTGGVLVALNPTIVDEDFFNPTWEARNNQFTASEELINALLAGDIYVNVHTLDNGSGEIRGQVRPSINFRPGAATIAAPDDGAELTLAGEASQEFAASWNAAPQDRDGDLTTYVWQLAADEEFSAIVFAATVGTDTAFVTDFGTVDALLESAGVPTGGTFTVYHRAVATDGSDYQFGPAASVVLTRGQLTSVTENQPLGFEALVFPTTVKPGQTATLRLGTDESFQGQVFLYDQLGRPVIQRTVEVRNGEQMVPLATGNLPSGQYFVTLRLASGKIAYTSRLIVQ